MIPMDEEFEMFDMSFRNIAYLRMKYDFNGEFMIFDIICEGEWEDNPLILYEVNVEEAEDIVSKGIGIWVLDGTPCVDENQAIASARSQAKYIRKAFEYVAKAYNKLKANGEIDGIRSGQMDLHPSPQEWGKVGKIRSNNGTGQGA